MPAAEFAIGETFRELWRRVAAIQQREILRMRRKSRMEARRVIGVGNVAVRPVGHCILHASTCALGTAAIAAFTPRKSIQLKSARRASPARTPRSGSEIWLRTGQQGK